jgi:hypothetical protein
LSHITISIDDALQKRNDLWQGNSAIPGWVDIDNVALDQFFTVPDVAQKCHDNLLCIMANNGQNPAQYKFIEPSAGQGVFLDLLPKDRRIGLDIMPQRIEIDQQDFLSWSIKPNGYRYAVVGNPPFGYRAWLALAFVNHAAKFADYIGMILPMAFQSDGKGSPKHRVEGMELLHSEVLPPNSFTDAHGNPVKVNALWQVWRKGVNTRAAVKTCDDWIDLFTVDQRKERLCGHMRMHEADHFLQRTFYRDPPNLVKDFAQVKYVCGYGIVIKQKKRDITQFLRSVDWHSYSNLAAHNCRHISMYHIRSAMTDGGFVDA